ncbi:MAG: TonB-dependent siderophore receptor [Pseudomonas sp.]|uniref:TonB-dependent siderophore receptor n=1 Tax=Pseudomonas sp. TaxID=306 RepID=UPI0027369ABA|nr:TonB-dependent siderophore receptor [Pseudomonas sp.]MDP3846056.1 TonB-dependent siderophore receptor [Pseudomonas sp.]
MLTGIACSGTSWAEQQAEALDLPAQTVTGAQHAETRVTVGSKTPVKLREVPQTVNVVGQERIEEQNLYTLEQAMKQVGGVTVQRIDANRVTYFARGFEINSLQLDGTPTTMDNRLFLSPDLAMYERVEVLKGPAGILNGTGGTGGSINLVRKRPQAEAAVSGELSAGSWDDYRSMLDVTGPLTESGNIRGRAVMSQRDRHFYYDGGDEKSNLFYGVVEADLTPDTLLTLGASHQEVDARGAQRSLPAYLSRDAGGQWQMSLADPSRSNFYGADWNRDYFWSDSVFAELEQHLAAGWKAKLSLRHADNNFDLTQAYARNAGGINPTTNRVSISAIRFDYREEQNEVDAYVDGPFSLLGREHKLLVGANYSRSEFFNKGDYDFVPRGSVDLFDPQIDVAQPVFDPQQDIFADTRQHGLYSNLRLSLADPLTLVLGGRLSWWDFSNNTTPKVTGLTAVNEEKNIDGKFIPFAGLVYDLTDTYSLYASYAEVFQPHNARTRDINGKMLTPLEGEQWETGVKGEYLDGALTASFALFQVEEQNRATPDLTDSSAAIAGGKARSRGYETELSGQLAEDWTLNANYSYTHKIHRSEESTELYTPKHILRVWSQYQLPGEWQRWSVQGGMNAVSEAYTKTNFAAFGINDVKLEQGGYTLFDAGVGYQITPQLSADVLATNLTDKKYYQRINNPQDGNIWGDPRAATLTLRAKF